MNQLIKYFIIQNSHCHRYQQVCHRILENFFSVIENMVEVLDEDQADFSWNFYLKECEEMRK